MYLILYSIQCPGKYCIQMYLMCILKVFRTVRPVRLDPHSEYCIYVYYVTLSKYVQIQTEYMYYICNTEVALIHVSNTR